jgi:hypothetical protein
MWGHDVDRRPGLGDSRSIMTDPIRLETYPKAAAQKMRRRRRGLGLTVILVAIALLLWARMGQLASGQEASAEAAAQALARAVAGDLSQLEDAREGFRRASGGMIVDAYPVFAMTVVEQVAAGEVTLPDPALAAVVEAIAQGDLKTARVRSDGLQDILSRTWSRRLLDDMGAPPSEAP